MPPFLQALIASAISGVFVGLVAWYGNKKTSSHFFGRLVERVDETVRRVGVLEEKADNYHGRISTLEGAKANGAPLRFPN